MIVQPDFINHPKLLHLVQEFGWEAVAYVLRLWAHCQQNQRGEDWGRVDARYVEAVCMWKGEPAKLFTALLNGVAPGRKGFAELRNGHFIVHEWIEKNQSLVANWNRNRSGLPKPNNGRTSGKHNAALYNRQPHGPPDKRRGEEIGEDQIGENRRGEKGSGAPEHSMSDPTEEEVIARGTAQGLTEAECRDFYRYYDGLGWTHRGTKMVRWWRWLPKCHERQQEITSRAGESLKTGIPKKRADDDPEWWTMNISALKDLAMGVAMAAQKEKAARIMQIIKDREAEC